MRAKWRVCLYNKGDYLNEGTTDRAGFGSSTKKRDEISHEKNKKAACMCVLVQTSAHFTSHPVKFQKGAELVKCSHSLILLLERGCYFGHYCTIKQALMLGV